MSLRQGSLIGWLSEPLSTHTPRPLTNFEQKRRLQNYSIVYGLSEEIKNAIN